MLELSAISKAFSQEEVVLANISLAFGDTGLACIVGEAGAGKTTLLKIIAGIESPSGGSVRYNGANISSAKASARDRFRREAIGYIPQENSLAPALTAAENVQIALQMAGFSKKDAKKLAISSLGRYHLASLANKKASQLSTGEAQKVLITRALASQPRILLADEPFQSLGTDAAASIAAILREAAKVCLVIVSTSSEANASLLGCRTIHLDGMTIKSDDSPLGENPFQYFESFAGKASSFSAKSKNAAAAAKPPKSQAGKTDPISAALDTIESDADIIFFNRPEQESDDALPPEANGWDSPAFYQESPQSSTLDVSRFYEQGAYGQENPEQETSFDQERPRVESLPPIGSSLGYIDPNTVLATGATYKQADPSASGTKSPNRRTGFKASNSLAKYNAKRRIGRTLLTVLAGCIGVFSLAFFAGIIGGVNTYVSDLQDETLRSQPLVISSSAIDLDQYLGTGAQTNNADEKPQHNSNGDRVFGVEDQIGESFNSVGKMTDSIHANNLDALKASIESNSFGAKSSISTLSYDYGITPLIFAADTKEGIRQINPDSLLSTGGVSAIAGASTFLGAEFETNLFATLPPDETLYTNAYEVLAGRWPSNDTECVLVVGPESARISDYALYQMGLLDYSEVEQMIKDFQAGNPVEEYSHAQTFTYDELMSCKFKLVIQAACYQYNERYNAWVNKSSDEDFMRGVIDASENISVVGVVSYSGKGSPTLKEGFYLPATIQTYLIERATGYPIVQNQLDNPNVDIFTGKAFSEDLTLNDLKLGSMIDFEGDALMEALFLTFRSLDLPTISLNKTLFGEEGADDYDWKAKLGEDSDFDPDFTLKGLKLTESDMSKALEGVGVDLSGMPAPSVNGLDITSGNAANARSLASSLMNGYLASFATYDSSTGYVTDLRIPYEAEMIWFIESSEFEYGVINAFIGNSPVTADQYLQLETWYEETLASYLIEQSRPSLETLNSNLASLIETALEKHLGPETVKLLEALLDETECEDIIAAMQKSMEEMDSEEIDFEAIADVIGEVIVVTPNENGVASEDLGSAFSKIVSSDLAAGDVGGLLTLMLGRGSSYESNIDTLGYANPDQPKGISIYTNTLKDRQEVASALDRYNEKAIAADNEGDVILYSDIIGTLVSPLSDVIVAVEDILGIPLAVLFALFFVTLCIITALNVAGWQQEIKVLRQLGASRSDITLSVLAQNLAIGLIIGIIGIIAAQVAGTVLTQALTSSIESSASFSISASQGLSFVLFSVAASLLAGLFPALRAGVLAKKD